MTDRATPGRRLVVAAGLWALAGCSTAVRPETPTPAADATTATPTPSATPTPTMSQTPTPSATASSAGPSVAPPPWSAASVPSRASVVAAYAGHSPKEWGLAVTGVVSRLEQPVGVALTFDACGGSGGGAGYDEKLIALLRQHQVASTLFLNQRWITANPSLAAELAADPLFEIESHGVRHLPLSVTGASAYGIAGTKDVGEAYDEVVAANDWFTSTLGRVPWFFRPGTAYADEVAAKMSRNVGQVVAGFSVNGDAGATFSPGQVASAVGGVRAGDIVISHMNRPGKGTADGYAAALPRLIDRGVTFVHLRQGF
ncbi:MAG: polysaccharide deacetylase family protein [Actinobacteria bacterium]|nr:polysaccharide deacetylase family protein [Actinomycetota bacterium]